MTDTESTVGQAVNSVNQGYLAESLANEALPQTNAQVNAIQPPIPPQILNPVPDAAIPQAQPVQPLAQQIQPLNSQQIPQAQQPQNNYLPVGQFAAQQAVPVGNPVQAAPGYMIDPQGETIVHNVVGTINAQDQLAAQPVVPQQVLPAGNFAQT